MKILVVSDSHSGLSYMRRWAEVLRPQVVIHLGDYYDDADLFEEMPWVHRLYRVPGNCDLYRSSLFHQREVCFEELEGVSIWFTHGHRHGVKQGIGKLMETARLARADVVLYGHTHQAECFRTEDGIWVMNPGSCGGYGGSVGLLRVERGQVLECRILRAEDMDEFA